MAGPQLSVERDGDMIRIVRGQIVMRLPVVEWDLLVARGNRITREIQRPVEPPNRMSDHQRRHLHALLREQGATGDGRFPVLAGILGREIGSTNDLSRAEAEQCIAALSRVREVPNEPEAVRR